MTTYSSFKRSSLLLAALLLLALTAHPLYAQIAEVQRSAEPMGASSAPRGYSDSAHHQATTAPETASRAYAASCTFGGPGHDVKNAAWHSYVAPSDGTVSVTVAGIDVDLILTFMDASRTTELACADEGRFNYTGGIGFETISDFPVTAGGRYVFRTTTRSDRCNHGQVDYAFDFHTEVSFEPSADVPHVLSLAPSFSYPTLDSATLTYTLLEPGIVRFKVYDREGRLVRSLVNETRAAGLHEVVFQTGDLTPGVYTVRAEHQGGVQTQQMRLTR